MKAKHTPGPWEVREYVDYTVTVESIYNSKVVAVCKNSLAIGTKEAMANARLIAAAPDLLAALEEIADQPTFDEVMDGRTKEDCVELYDEFIIKARSAIAKAAAQTPPPTSLKRATTPGA